MAEYTLKLRKWYERFVALLMVLLLLFVLGGIGAFIFISINVYRTQIAIRNATSVEAQENFQNTLKTYCGGKGDRP